MTAQTRVYGGLAGAPLPIAATDIDDDALAFRDPAQELLLGLFAAALDYELSDSWAKVCAALPPDSILSGSLTPVVSRSKILPSPEVLSQIREGWPLLAVTRKGEAPDELFAADVRISRQQWEVSWIIGPVGLAEAIKLQGALPYLKSCVSGVLQRRGHVAYQSGAVVLSEATSPFLDVQLAAFEGGFAQIAEDGPQLLACTVTLDSVEQYTRTVGHLSTVDGVEFHFDLADGDADPIVDFVEDSTTVPAD